MVNLFRYLRSNLALHYTYFNPGRLFGSLCGFHATQPDLRRGFRLYSDLTPPFFDTRMFVSLRNHERTRMLKFREDFRKYRGTGNGGRKICSINENREVDEN